MQPEPAHISAKRSILAILVLAALLRFYGLSDESLWLDEATTAWRVQRPLSQMWFDWDNGAQAPVYYVALSFLVRAFGVGETALRFPSAVVGVLSVPAIYLFARAFTGHLAACLAALLLAINPFAIHYSQEARPYALLFLLTTMSFALLLRVSRGGGARTAVAYVACTACALYTHPYSPFLMVAHASLYAIGRRVPARDANLAGRRHLTAGAVALIVLVLPQIVALGLGYAKKSAGGDVARWIPEPTLRDLGGTLLNYFMWRGLGVAVLVVLLVAVVHFVTRDARGRAAFASLAAVIASFTLLPWVASKVAAPIYVSRYSMPALAAVLVLVGAGLAALRGRWRTLAVVTLILLHGVPLYRYYTMVDKDPWREAAAFLQDASEPGDVALSVPHWTVRPLRYYLGRFEGIRLATPRTPADAESVTAGVRRVWLVESYSLESDVAKGVRATIAASRVAGESVTINEPLAINPNARHVQTIRVTPFVARDTPASVPGR